MRLRSSWAGGIFLLMTTIGIGLSQGSVQTGAAVCSQPDAICPTGGERFDPWDLAFPLPKNLKWQTTYYSAPFFAILLKSVKAEPDDGPGSDKPCAGYIREDERQRVQRLFQDRKVFASRYGCSEFLTGYTNVNAEYNFLAVYGGKTQAEAEKMLARVRATGQFPDANIRKMQALYDNGD